MFMAGCTKDIATHAPVPVQLEVSSVDMKAMINSSSQIRNLPFGVFAFDKAAVSLAADDGLMMRNQSAVGVVTGGKSSLKLSKTSYYPLNKSTEFAFYSYYAYPLDKITSEVTQTQALVKIPVTGVYDVLWAKSSVDGGYNAGYIRDGGAHPSFHFSHPTACLSFTANIENEIANTHVRLSSLSLVAPEQATLCVADIKNPENEGRFVSAGDDVLKLVINDSYTGNLNLLLSQERQKCCQDVFIVPGKPTLTVKASFVIRGAGADGTPGTSDDVIQNANAELILRAGDGKVFEPGYIYSFNLKMKSPTQVTFEIGGDDQIKVEGFKPAFQ